MAEKMKKGPSEAGRKTLKCPHKQGINLNMREQKGNPRLTLLVGCLAIAILAGCVAKFGVIDQYRRLDAAQAAYASVHTEYTQMQELLKGYDRLLMEYRTYSMDWMTAAGSEDIPAAVDRQAALDLLEQECTRQEKPHAVIIMADLGDLREGYWDHEEMVQTCLYVEHRLPHVHLSGVGVNLSCYGSVRATPEKMQMLLAIARRVEDAIGRPLEIVSGGATSSYPLIHTGTMPAGINHLRIGENILTAQDIADSWGVHDADYLRDDVFRLEAEVVEVKEKPTYPQGELGADAFGRKPVYEDRGLRLRAILALGRADVGDMETLRPTMPGVTVIGGSSDHCILDVTDAPQPVQVGDVLSFRLCYSHVLYATQRDDVPVVICP